MAVASTYAENLECALGRIGNSFFDRESVGPPRSCGRPGNPSEFGRTATQWPRTSRPAGWKIWATQSFVADHRLRYPCMSGAMANGIGSVEIVEAMGRRGFLGVFGAAGLPLTRSSKRSSGFSVSWAIRSLTA